MKKSKYLKKCKLNYNYNCNYKKHISIFITFILLFNFTFNIHTFAIDNITLGSRAAIVYELNTDEILYSKNIHEKLYPASLTKFLTGLLTVECGNVNDTLTFTKEATTLLPNSSTLNFMPDEKTTVNHALYGLMVRSANEIGNQLALYIEEKTGLSFEDNANKKLKEIGANESNFITPTGLHEANHYTTAYDLALLAKASYNNETFRKYFSTLKYKIPATNLSKEREIYSTHKMLYTSSPYHLSSVIGGKTGTTDEAGNTLVTFAEKDGILIAVVVLKADGVTMACEDTYKLINYTFNNFENKKIFSKDEVIKEIPIVNVYDVEEGMVELKTEKDFYITILKTDGETFSTIPESHENEFYTFTSNIPDKINSSVIYGDVLGSANYKTNTNIEKSINIISNTDFNLNSTNTKDYTTILTYLFIIAGLILVVSLVFFFKTCKDEKNVDVVEKKKDKYNL